MLNNYPDVMTVQQTAQALGVGEGSIYRMVRENILGCRRIGRKIIVPKVCVIDYLNSARYTVSRL